MLILTAHSTVLFSVLTLQKPLLPFRSILELVENSQYKLCIQEGSALKYFLNIHKYDKRLSKLENRIEIEKCPLMFNGVLLETQIENICKSNSKLGFIAPSSTVDLHNLIRGSLVSSISCDLQIVQRNVYTRTTAIPIGSHFRSLQLFNMMYGEF